MSANRNIRRRLRRKIVECRKGLEWLREEAAADEAEQLLSERG